MKTQTVLVLDFGGQYKELIARCVRNMSVYSEIRFCETPIEEIKELAPIGIILTGGPNSVYGDSAPTCDKALFELGIPILGICYGMQFTAYSLGGEVVACKESEYGKIKVKVDTTSALFKEIAPEQIALMSHTDRVSKLPKGFKITSSTKNCPVAAMENKEKNIYSVQFHPEVERTEHGKEILHNFVFDICGAVADYSMDDYIENQIKEIREKVGNERVVLGLSGGVDSSVCAALIGKAIGEQLTCIFVDHGMMRKNEGDEIEKEFSTHNINFVRVNAGPRFLAKLEGVADPEKKRKIIGTEFVRVFEEEAKKCGAKFLAQGTIYPDVIESGAKNSANIKSHHNVGGLPKDMGFIGLVEPLRGLFKDEVRVLGRKLGLSVKLVERQPFPGPGLAVRIIGDITEAKLVILKEADSIFCMEVEKLPLAKRPHQYFAVLTGMRSVGVMGDCRTYDYTIAVRAVTTTDFMTAEYAPLPHKLLGRVSSRIANEVNGASRVVYDITGKPPATIEWE
ncbi:MAG: glutamine-hydrolyzing GMP synthase [Clostridia bacterium]|nr:glutamine-hydrolyzing GMP synthase [Clostridia bacterium]